MRKLTTALCGAVLAVALAAGSASAAGKAGIGLEWGYVPTIEMGAFGADLTAQEFTLAWDISDAFQVGVFRGTGHFRGDHAYNDNLVSPVIERTNVVTGNTEVSGLRFLTTLPVMNNMIAIGIEAGAIEIVQTNREYLNSDGTVSTQADFMAAGGYAPEDLDLVAPLLGVTAKIRLIEAKGKTVTTALTVAGALRFVPMDDTFVFGSREETTLPADQTKIDPVTGFHNFAITAGVGLWF